MKLKLLVVFVVLTFASVANGLQLNQSQLSDAELLERLASPNGQSADEAAALILSRGERMIGPLMKLRGDKRFYMGLMHQNPRTSDTMFLATGNAEEDQRLLKNGELVTVEVAALYLISAIYHKDVSFAHAPFLTDLSVPAVERRRSNTRKLIDRAWKATEKWYRNFTASSLEKLRAADEYPLKAAKVKFW